MHIYYVAGVPYSDELYHHGIKGMHWGTRLYQYEDGTLTPLGKIHYGAKKAGEATEKALKVTGKAVGKVGKRIAKYEVEKFKRNHPWMMDEKELDAAIIRAKKVETLRNSMEVSRGKTFAGKLSNTLWNSVNKFGETTASNAGQKFANSLFESSEAKKARKYRDRINLSKAEQDYRERELQAKKDYDNYTYRRDLYTNSKKAETSKNVEKAKSTAKNVVQKTKSAVSKASDMYRNSRIGSKKSVDDYVNQVSYEQEKERRKKLYGPRGTAYR